MIRSKRFVTQRAVDFFKIDFIKSFFFFFF